MAYTRIKSWENKTFRYIFSLITKKGREASAAFIIEGERFTEEAAAYCDVQYIAVSETFERKNYGALNSYPADKVLVMNDFLFDKIASTENAQGILAVCAMRRPGLEGMLAGLREKPLLLLAEDIADPGNLGTIIRTADAAGAAGVVLSQGCVELHNPKVLRAAAGSTFHLPIVEDTDIRAAIRGLTNAGISVYAAHLNASAYPYNLDLTKGCAFLVGNESRGLTTATAALAESLVRLPMPGKAESLNAAVATGILLYEAVRQRAVADGTL